MEKKRSKLDIIRIKIEKEAKRILNIKELDNNKLLLSYGKKGTVRKIINRINSFINVNLEINDFGDDITINLIVDHIKKIAYSRGLNNDNRKKRMIKSAPHRKYYPLSRAQRRMWLPYKLNSNSSLYNFHYVCELYGEIDARILKKSVEYLIRRYSILRTNFLEKNGQPIQVIREKIINAHFKSHNLTNIINKTERQKKVNEIVNRQIITPFKLETDPLLRTAIINGDKNKYILVLVMHHIITDLRSMQIFIHELHLVYNAFMKKEEPGLTKFPIQYIDYTEWEQLKENKKNIQKQEKYWLNRLSGVLTMPHLPIDFPRPLIATNRGSTEHIFIDAKTTDRIKKMCKHYNVTVFVFLFAVFYVFLHRISGQNELIVGTAVANRRHEELENIIGVFFNIIPIRIKLFGSIKFIDLLFLVRNAVIDAAANESYSLDRLVEKLNLERDASRPPIFNCTFFYNSKVKNTSLLTNLKTKYRFYHNKTVKYDLRVYSAEVYDGKISFRIEYATDLFTPKTIQKYLHYCLKLIKDVLGQPDKKVYELNLLSAEQKTMLINKYNDTKCQYPNTKVLHQLFEDQVKKTPRKNALIFQEKKLTYSELNCRANQLAHYLKKEYKIKPDTVVGIMLERSPEFTVSILAVLKAGGAYMPVDLELPGERVNYMFRDAKCEIVISNKTPARSKDKKLQITNYKLQTIDIDNNDLFKKYQIISPKSINKPTDLAYIMYTSGSTGRPKGVMIEHRSVINYLSFFIKTYKINSRDKVLQITPYTFDPSIRDIFVTLTCGATLVLTSHYNSKDPNVLSRMIERQKVTKIISIVPSFLKQVIMAKKSNVYSWKNLNHIFTCGEQLYSDAYYKFKTELRKKCLITNQYGPTECTMVAATFTPQFKLMKKGINIPVGKPIQNTQIYILDNNMKLVPPGIPGEVYISGSGLARGYLNEAKLTSEVFLPHPFIKGERIYKTGDLAKIYSDGNIEILGRLDHQIKIRGKRIESGEITVALKKLYYIEDCVVVKYEESLIAYYTTITKKISRPEIIRNYLAQIFPNYMIPRYFIHLMQIPLNPNGKLDQKALPAPTAGQIARQKYEPPAGMEEKKLARVWRELFDIDKISRHDNFFNLGGHSVLAIRVLSRINKDFKIELFLKDLFQYPVLADLARIIERKKKIILPVIIPAPKKRNYPLSHAQKRMFILYKFEPRSPFYNIRHTRELSGRLNITAIKKAFSAMFSRHEILRTNFKEAAANQPVQIIHSEPRTDLKIIDMMNIKNITKRRLEIKKTIKKNIDQPFILEIDPLLRTTLIKTAKDNYILIIVVHHIIFDGWSIGIFWRELTQIYNVLLKNQRPDLSPPPLQYKDYAVWEQSAGNNKRLAKHEKYWLKKLKGDLPTLNLPIDNPRPPIQTYRGSAERLILSPDTAKKISGFCRKHDVTPFMFMLSVFNIFLYRLTGEDDIMVGTPSSDRNYAETENMIGFITNTLVIRSHIMPSLCFVEFLKQTRENVLEIFNHKNYPFEKLVEKLNPKRDMSRHPLFNVLFQLFSDQMYGGAPADFQNIHTNNKYFEQNTVVTDLRLIVAENGNSLILNCRYNTDLFCQETINKLLHCYQILINDILVRPDQKISKLNILSPETKNKLLIDFNRTKFSYPQTKTIPQLFEEQAKKAPEAIALRCDNQILTYRELDQKANQLAHYLTRKHKIKPDDIVAVMLERSPEMLVSILAVLKAGGAYLPIDHKYPERRIKFMLRDGRVKAVITNGKDLKFKNLDLRLEIIDLSNIQYTNNLKYLKNPKNLANQDNLAYIIYTSGSTGKPKGVMIEHGSVINFIYGIKRAIQFKANKKILFVNALTFDMSVFETLLPLLLGLEIIIADEETRKDPSRLKSLILKEGINILKMAPTLASIIIDDHDNKHLKHVKKIILGGEQISAYSANKLKKLKNKEIYNLYGPTETTVYSTINKLKSFDKITAGQPLANTQVYVLDNNMGLLPSNIPGELYISGDGLARGYFGDIEKTSAAFLLHPFLKNKKIYKTGDRARIDENGNVEILSRVDHQIKIRGYRIEPGEVETAIKKRDKHIREAVVIKKETSGGKNEDCYLAAFYTTTSKEPVNTQKLKNSLNELLPDYMIPAYFIHLSEIPLTPNGKIDRGALPEPQEKDLLKKKYEPPLGLTEEKLAQIWQEVLNVQKISRNDNFFDLGGHSLKAIEVLARINNIFNINLALKSLFQNTTIQELGHIIDELIIERRIYKNND